MAIKPDGEGGGKGLLAKNFFCGFPYGEGVKKIDPPPAKKVDFFQTKCKKY